MSFNCEFLQLLLLKFYYWISSSSTKCLYHWCFYLDVTVRAWAIWELQQQQHWNVGYEILFSVSGRAPDGPGTWRKFVTSCKHHRHKYNCRLIVCCKAMQRPHGKFVVQPKNQDGRQKYSQMPFIKQYIIVCRQESQKTQVFQHGLFCNVVVNNTELQKQAN